MPSTAATAIRTVVVLVLAWALVFAAAVLFIGFLLSLLIPRISPERRRGEPEAFDTFEAMEALDPMDADPGYMPLDDPPTESVPPSPAPLEEK